MTRPFAGARLAWAVLGLAGSLAAATAYAAGPGPGPLPWRVGGRAGFTADAASFPDSAGTALDVYIRIPPATLTFLERDSADIGRLRITARLRGAYGGGRSQEQSQEFDIEPADSAQGFGKVVVLRFPARPGPYRLMVRLDDLRSRKRGLAYMGRKVNESASVEGELRVPGPTRDRQMSDLEFVWTERRGGAPTPFDRGGRTVLPNPERLYGLFESRVQTFFAVRGRPEDARPWHWVARVRDARDSVVAARESSAVAGPWLQGGSAFDLSTEPAGGYTLEVRVWQEGDRDSLARQSRFSVAWKAGSWMRNPREVEDEVHFLLSADDEEAFALLSPGEQERLLDDFWQVRDPSPGTGENEAQRTFLARVEYSNRQWTRAGLGRGMFSDMGRVYIRHGEPSEIVRQVIPTGDNTVDRILAEIAANEDRALGDVKMKGPGGDTRAFELWIYDPPVAPTPDADPQARGYSRLKRLYFLFVDEQGVGDLRLRYSTE